MEISEKEIAQGRIVTLIGHLDTITAVEIQKKIINLIRSGTKALFIDFNGVEYISSPGIRALILISKSAKDCSAFVCIVNPSKHVEEILEMTGALAFIRIYKDLQTALQPENGN